MLYVTCYKCMLLHAKLNIYPYWGMTPKTYSYGDNPPVPFWIEKLPISLLGNDYHPHGTVATFPMEQEQGIGL